MDETNEDTWPFRMGDEVVTVIGDTRGTVIEVRSPWTVTVMFDDNVRAVYGVSGLRPLEDEVWERSIRWHEYQMRQAQELTHHVQMGSRHR